MAESLWAFASRCYALPGVAEQCLALQDRVGADVNMLLVAAWLAARGQRWGRADVESLVAHAAAWRSECLLPLRAVRRYLKKNAVESAIYHQAKALELEAEKVQLLAIEAEVTMLAASPGAPSNLLVANLQTYAEVINLGSAQALVALAKALASDLGASQ